MREGEFAAEALGPEDGDGGGQRGDAAPGEVEATELVGVCRGRLAGRNVGGVHALHVRGAGGVVGGDEVQGAIDEGGPELFAVGGGADGGGGFAEGWAIGVLLDGFGG